MLGEQFALASPETTNGGLGVTAISPSILSDVTLTRFFTPRPVSNAITNATIEATAAKTTAMSSRTKLSDMATTPFIQRVRTPRHNAP
jgi:hypothetical protein